MVKKIRQFCGILLLILFYQQVSAQCGHEWLWAYQSEVVDKYDVWMLPKSSCIDRQGNIYVAGTSWMVPCTYQGHVAAHSGTYGFDDLYLFKLDKNGNFIWGKSYGGRWFDKLLEIKTDNLGNVYICGSTDSDSLQFDNHTVYQSWNSLKKNTGDRGFIVKYDPDGNVLWVYQNLEEELRITDIAITEDREVYASGFTTGYEIVLDENHTVVNQYKNIYHMPVTMRLDSMGRIIWARTIAKEAIGSVYTLKMDIDQKGNAYVSGYFGGDHFYFANDTFHCYTEGDEYFLVKYDKDGNELWGRDIPLNIYDLVHVKRLRATPGGNVYMYGEFNASNGNTDPNDDFIVMGKDTLLQTYPITSYFLVKYNTDGDIVWARSSKGNGSMAMSEGFDMKVDEFENIYVSQSMFRDSLVIGDTVLKDTITKWYGFPFIVKYDSSGDVLWGKHLFGESYLNSCTHTLDIDGNLIMAGQIYYGNMMVVGKDTLWGNMYGSSNQMYVMKLNNDLNMKATQHAPVCNGDLNGKVEVKVQGGIPPLKISWDTGDSSLVLNNLEAGQYDLRIEDQSNCILKESFLLDDPPYLDVKATSTPDSTQLCIGTATAIINGGIPPYSYQWDDPKQQSTATATQLCGGYYTLTVTDSNGCVGTTTVTVSKSSALEEMQHKLFNIYPNPSRDGTFKLLIEKNQDFKCLIFDAKGNRLFEIYEKDPTSEQFSIDLSDYPEGVYYARIHINGQWYTRELLTLK